MGIGKCYRGLGHNTVEATKAQQPSSKAADSNGGSTVADSGQHAEAAAAAGVGAKRRCASGLKGDAGQEGEAASCFDGNEALVEEALPEFGCKSFNSTELVKDALKVLSEDEKYISSAQRLKLVLQYRAAIRAASEASI